MKGKALVKVQITFLTVLFVNQVMFAIAMMTRTVLLTSETTVDWFLTSIKSKLKVGVYPLYYANVVNVFNVFSEISESRALVKCLVRGYWFS